MKKYKLIPVLFSFLAVGLSPLSSAKALTILHDTDFLQLEVLDNVKNVPFTLLQDGQVIVNDVLEVGDDLNISLSDGLDNILPVNIDAQQEGNEFIISLSNNEDGVVNTLLEKVLGGDLIQTLLDTDNNALQVTDIVFHTVQNTAQLQLVDGLDLGILHLVDNNLLSLVSNGNILQIHLKVGEFDTGTDTSGGSGSNNPGSPITTGNGGNTNGGGVGTGDPAAGGGCSLAAVSSPMSLSMIPMLLGAMFLARRSLARKAARD